ncbi:MAG: hypothetical protein WAM09_01525 [Anaerolineales bacterium]|jgi:hypothetical protein
MFEDFRKQIEDASFTDEDQTEKSPVENPFSEQRFFLGLTPVQRFIVALMLLMMTIILGVLFLLVTSKIVPPFLG